MAKRPRFNLSSFWRKLQLGLDERQHLRGEVPWLHRFLHFWVLVWTSFVRNRCLIRASALSYTTLLALIPMLAVALSVTSSLLKTQGEQQIDQFIEHIVANTVPQALLKTNAPVSGTDPDDEPDSASPTTSTPAPGEAVAQPESSESDTNGVAVAATEPSAVTEAISSIAQDEKVIAARKQISSEIRKFIANTRSGTLGVTGMIFLLFVAISMLSRVEETFNDIWGVTRGRNWFTRVIRYWAVLTLGPVLLATAFGLTSGPFFQSTKDVISEVPFMSRIFPLLPLAMLWITFALLYQLVPNTRVHLTAALVGGVVAGSLWHLNNVFGFLYVSRVVTNSKIYGTLGLVPVFMAGLYLSWLILLLGAQVAYVFQNRAGYLQEKLAENVNQRGREFVALRLMTCIGQRFQGGHRPVSVSDMSAELGIPTRLIEQVLHILVSANLVMVVSGEETGYTPARPLADITCHHVLQAMRAGQGQELATRDEPARAEVLGEFARIQEAERKAASSVTMLALVKRAQAQLQLPTFSLLDPGDEPASGKMAHVNSQPAPVAVEEQPEAASSLAASKPAIEDETSSNVAPASTSPITSQKTEEEEERDFPL